MRFKHLGKASFYVELYWIWKQRRGKAQLFTKRLVWSILLPHLLGLVWFGYTSDF